MKCAAQVPGPLLKTVAFLLLCAAPAGSQVREIDRAKLPQTKTMQQVYTDLLPIDHFARSPVSAPTWRYPVPKAEIESQFLLAFQTLEKQQKLEPENKELQLFIGLVAHLAYNLGIDEDYRYALSLLQSLAAEDYRAAWFLGMQQCQSGDPVRGMQRLLRVEVTSPVIPGGFWDDYANCAGVANMPVHAVRAYDLERRITQAVPTDEQLEQSARDRIKPGSVITTYPSKQAWINEKAPDGNRLTSKVCGESFLVKPTFHLNVADVIHGTCIVTIDTEQYPSRYGPSSGSLLLLTQAARQGESLSAFARRILQAFTQNVVKDPGEGSTAPLDGMHCPVASCQSFEISTKKLYKSEGGAHLIAVFFQVDQPEYPGLRFESPQPLPKLPVNAVRPAPGSDEAPQRFEGPLYTFVTLDANQDIYPRARIDFDDLLKSLIVDSKPIDSKPIDSK
jgi:hypothetical protein